MIPLIILTVLGSAALLVWTLRIRARRQRQLSDLIWIRLHAPDPIVTLKDVAETVALSGALLVQIDEEPLPYPRCRIAIMGSEDQKTLLENVLRKQGVFGVTFEVVRVKKHLRAV